MVETLKGWERGLAQVVHVLFYVVMIGMPLTGWAFTSASPLIHVFPIVLYHAIPWPTITPLANLPHDQMKSAHHFFLTGHTLLAKLAYGLIALHMAGALKHQFIDRDTTLARMILFLITVRHGEGGLSMTMKTISVRICAAAPLVPGALASPASRRLPPSGAVDPATSKVSFKGAMNGEAFTGVFKRWTADIAFDPQNLAASKAAVALDMGSAVTGGADRDQAHADSADWFSVAHFPKATFVTSSIENSRGADHHGARRTIAIRGVSKPGLAALHPRYRRRRRQDERCADARPHRLRRRPGPMGQRQGGRHQGHRRCGGDGAPGPLSADIQAAVRALKAGDLVILPTETVYGLAADAANAAAIARLFEAKGRPRFNPLIAHVTDLAGAGADCAAGRARALALAEAFWPGPLTLVAPIERRRPPFATSPRRVWTPSPSGRLPIRSPAPCLRPLEDPSPRPPPTARDGPARRPSKPPSRRQGRRGGRHAGRRALRGRPGIHGRRGSGRTACAAAPWRGGLGPRSRRMVGPLARGARRRRPLAHQVDCRATMRRTRRCA